MAQRNEEQYRIKPSPKAGKSDFEASYEYTTGNNTSKKERNKRK